MFRVYVIMNVGLKETDVACVHENGQRYNMG